MRVKKLIRENVVTLPRLPLIYRYKYISSKRRKGKEKEGMAFHPGPASGLVSKASQQALPYTPGHWEIDVKYCRSCGAQETQYRCTRITGNQQMVIFFYIDRSTMQPKGSVTGVHKQNSNGADSSKEQILSR
ncbi:uncharacterized protein LOC143154379 [Ptiloglossa arizonensis]|uniref:uncharacterized protein LOC143154379 n=1 Tax=Ptiloglossa arizonensis TaxID=3350558 RepID=UPI003FA06C0B